MANLKKLMPVLLAIISPLGIFSTPALAQSVGFTVGFSTQSSSSISVSSEADIRTSQGFIVDGENVQPIGEPGVLGASTPFEIRDPDAPFSLLLQDLSGTQSRTAETQTNTISQGGSTSLSVFTSF